ncbi:Eco47II family restriction endonuclease [Mammaliicoccus sciuri]|uniref:Eco47II family restriction endonuclease n=1 Tax=Mammaliicoccus sciuri TaxID=1296 RepID=UPI00209E54E5|nr:Eco47II family restriction endonuclease [Mammaliicoccus sciuri]MCP1286271.1 Eco47II family restriction endonuclease [Mammaliicoccus sciuri]MDU0266369.1 Eco47II family restriction endonuclease [Mammaliicoccus sciuri]
MSKEKVKKYWDVEFITFEDFYEHVNTTLNNMYRKQTITNLKQFNKSIIDPTKMVFDSFTNGFSKRELIDVELYRQVDKSINNDIGYFHQNLFNYIKDWYVPDAGFDIENHTNSIFAEMKNKHNTMNSASSQKTYIKLQQKLLEDSNATCYLVEIIAKKSQDINWNCKVDGKNYSHDKIRRISIDKFYELVTGDKYAFKKICEWLPIVIYILNKEKNINNTTNDILSELQEIDSNFIDSIFKISYPTYIGFDNLNIRFKEQIPDLT